MIYLNNAASSFPKPESVYNAVMDCMKNCTSAPGRSSVKSMKDTENYITKARRLLAQLFNIGDPARIIFTLNDTYALNIAIKGVLRPGDHVVISCLEHNSIIRPLKNLEPFGIDTTVVNTDIFGSLDLEQLEKSITPRTRLIAVTQASNVIGTLTPTKEIGMMCKKHGIIFLVDAAQTAGVVPIDVKDMNIALLAFPGHKGLFGPMGTGGLYIRDDVDMIDIIQGGTGTVSESPVQPVTMPDRFESGTHNVPGIAGLSAGVEFILGTGINKIRDHEMKLTQQFICETKKIKGVKIYGSDNIIDRVSTVAINIKDMLSMDVSSILESKYGIVTRGGLHCAPYTHQMLNTIKQGAVRFSIGYFNNIKDIEKAVSALYEIAKESGR